MRRGGGGDEGRGRKRRSVSHSTLAVAGEDAEVHGRTRDMRVEQSSANYYLATKTKLGAVNGGLLGWKIKCGWVSVD